MKTEALKRVSPEVKPLQPLTSRAVCLGPLPCRLGRCSREAQASGAEVPQAAAAALGLRSGFLTSEDIFKVFKLLAGRLDRDSTPSETAVLGLVNLIVGVKGVLTLPAGFVADVRGRLLKMAKEEGTEAEHGKRIDIAAMMGSYTLLANGGPTCTLMGQTVSGGFSMERSTAATSADLVEALRKGMTSQSQRLRNASSRILGLLVALREVCRPRALLTSVSWGGRFAHLTQTNPAACGRMMARWVPRLELVWPEAWLTIASRLRPSGSRARAH